MHRHNEEILRLIRQNFASAHNANQFLTPVSAEPDTINDLSVNTGERFNSYRDALQWFDQERENLIDLIRNAGEIGEHQFAAAMPNLLWSYFNLTKRWEDWLVCNELGLASARAAGDIRSEAYLLMSQGVVYRNLRRLSEAKTASEKAVRLFQGLDDEFGLAYALQNLANTQSDAGLFDHAFSNFAIAVEKFSTITTDKRGKAVTLNSMASALYAHGRYEEAITAAQEASGTMQAIKDPHGRAIALHNLGKAYAALERTDEALNAFLASLEIRQEITDRHGEAQTLFALGDLDVACGHIDRATQRWTTALEIFTELDAPENADVRERLAGLTSQT